eukprot:768137-Hanusia_phi.AAC.8
MAGAIGESANVLVGRSTISQDYEAGSENIWIMSPLELFGPHVHYVKVDGQFIICLVDGVSHLTVRTAGSSAINVIKVENNKLSVTPASVRTPGREGDSIVFAGSGAFGLAGSLMTGTSEARVDMSILMREVELLDTLKVSSHEMVNDAAERHTVLGAERQHEAEKWEEEGDNLFWEGIQEEIKEDPIKLFYCPILDSRARNLNQSARLKYNEAGRLFGMCIEVDNTITRYYAKRCAAYCKLDRFEIAESDANKFSSIVPDTATAHMLKAVVMDGRKQFSAAIHHFKEALNSADLIAYDDRRVWSTGTLIWDSLQKTIRSQQDQIERAKTANLHGIQWREKGEYAKAIPCLQEAIHLNAVSLGKEHPFYATTLSNAGSCYEAMGNYDEALKIYNTALALTGSSCQGVVEVLVVCGRHLPGLREDDECRCNPFVEIAIAEEGGERKFCTHVRRCDLQPKWNQVIRIPEISGDSQMVIRLKSEHHMRKIHRENLETERKALQEKEEEISKLKSSLEKNQSDLEFLGSQGKRKQSLIMQKQEMLNNELHFLRSREAALATIRDTISHVEMLEKNLEDVEIGSFTFNVSWLSNNLSGAHEYENTSWFEVLDAQGKQVRGEDYGLSAVQVQTKWMPVSSEYSFKLSNIGNLHRILAERHLSVAGGQLDARKMEYHFEISERSLEASMVVMKRQSCKLDEYYLIPEMVKDMDFDLTPSDEVCIVLENLGRLFYSRSLEQELPKGTPEHEIAHLIQTWRKYHKKALRVFDIALDARSKLSGQDDKYLDLLKLVVKLHIEKHNFKDAYALQERCLEITRKIHGEESSSWNSELTVMSHLHAQAGEAKVVEHDRTWHIDSDQSWHWDMAVGISKRIQKQSGWMQRMYQEADERFQQAEEDMLKEKTRLLNPSPITDFSLQNKHSSLFAKLSAPRDEDSSQSKSLSKTRVRAAKFEFPDRLQVRMDAQSWPNRLMHTKRS